MPKGKIHTSIYGALKRSAINMSPLRGEKMLKAFALWNSFYDKAAKKRLTKFVIEIPDKL
jgi:hypothetical protein